MGNKSEADFLREAQEMQRRFREIGHVPRERMDDVYEKFKAQADKIYAALEPYLTKLDEERTANLEEKQKILAELRELLEEERPDWFAEDVGKLQQAWRAVGPCHASTRTSTTPSTKRCRRFCRPVTVLQNKPTLKRRNKP